MAAILPIYNLLCDILPKKAKQQESKRNSAHKIEIEHRLADYLFSIYKVLLSLKLYMKDVVFSKFISLNKGNHASESVWISDLT